jgi:hypothetical protein
VNELLTDEKTEAQRIVKGFEQSITLKRSLGYDSLSGGWIGDLPTGFSVIEVTQDFPWSCSQFLCWLDHYRNQLNSS